MGRTTTARQLSLEEIVQIVTETCEETAKDLNNFSKALQLIAFTTAQVFGKIRDENKIVIVDDTQSRDLQADLLTYQVMKKIKSRQKTELV